MACGSRVEGTFLKSFFAQNRCTPCGCRLQGTFLNVGYLLVHNVNDQHYRILLDTFEMPMYQGFDGCSSESNST